MFLRSAALIEGLRLDDPLQLGAMRVETVAYERGFTGRELRQTFNELLAEHGFATVVGRPAWGVQLGTRRRLCFACAPALAVDDIVEASLGAATVIGQMMDALALTYGGSPTVLALVNEKSHDGHAWEPFSLMAGSGARPGSVLERLLPDGDQLVALEPVQAWTRAMADPLVGLWLSLYRGITAEQRWDVKIFRCCSLLEAIGRERLDRRAQVLDSDGRALLDHGGEPATTGQLRGLIYALVIEAIERVATTPRVLLSHDAAALWSEVGIWADVRNMVGHEGLWRPPALSSTLAGAQRRSAAAFELAGRGDGLEAGWRRYTDAVAAGTEVVLRAAVLESTSPRAT